MRYDNLLAEVATSPGYVVLIFCVLWTIFYVVLVKLNTFDDLFWKRVDYVWLAAAAIGLITSSAQVNRALAQSYVEGGESARVVATYGFLRNFLNGPFWVCLPRNRTEFSPPDFDEIVREQQTLCRQAKEVAARMPRDLPSDFPTLESMGYQRIGVMAKYEAGFGKMLDDWAQQYQEQRAKYMNLVAASKQSGWELFMGLLGPLLLAFALALRITKVAGEVKNAKARLAANRVARGC